MYLTLTCLIVLLSASFALTGEKAATDMPSDEALTNAADKMEVGGMRPFKKCKYVGYNRIKDRDNVYQLFFEHRKGGLFGPTFKLYKINTGKWILGVYSTDWKAHIYVE
jgi:hypothetical protein